MSELSRQMTEVIRSGRYRGGRTGGLIAARAAGQGNAAEPVAVGSGFDGGVRRTVKRPLTMREVIASSIRNRRYYT